MANTLFEDLPKERSFRVVAHRSRSVGERRGVSPPVAFWRSGVLRSHRRADAAPLADD